MDFLKEISKGLDLKATLSNDRSAAAIYDDTPDVLPDEAERWNYFFSSGCEHWFEDIKEQTFSSTFCSLEPAEAEIIVKHWEERTVMLKSSASSKETDLEGLLQRAKLALAPLLERLQVAIDLECAKSSEERAFVKLSTRSPKDSKKALARAAAAYRDRVSTNLSLDDNAKWIILSEEVARASSVSSAAEALDLLLDSHRVFEDLEYALKGPSTEVGESNKPLNWRMSLVARSWDPRLTPESEFRGIVWNGKFTCLCQYFHPLHFPALEERKAEVERDIKAAYDSLAVRNAVARLGGHCIIDFAWLGPREVIVIELNPFDGVCLGTFPASTGLFLWEDTNDKAIMKGESPFEFRTRSEPLDPAALWNQTNSDWREIVSPHNHESAHENAA